jgi:hypothetical protein
MFGWMLSRATENGGPCLLTSHASGQARAPGSCLAQEMDYLIQNMLS